MSNSTRNSIVLGAILVLIFALWYWQYNGIRTQTDELLEANRKTLVSIDSLKVELSTIDSLRAEYELQEAMMHQQSKLVIGEDNPAVTYGYLLDVMRWMGLNIDFNFAATDTQKPEDRFHEYVINGSASYRNLLNLASQIENQRVAMTVEDLTINTDGAAKADTVTFSMVLHTHFHPGGPLANDVSLKALASPYTGYALFQPRIYDIVLPPEVDPSLLDVEDSMLLGMSRGMAFFRDSSGVIRILSKGSRVAWGYLYKIDEAAGKVIFRLDKYGLEEDYTIVINHQ